MKSQEKLLILLKDLRLDWEVVERARILHYPNVTDTEFSSLLGIPKSSYCDYKHGRSYPSLLVALRIAFLLDLDWREVVVGYKKVKKGLGLPKKKS